MKRQLYPAVLERGAKGTFGVWFPDFPGCVAGGRSQEETIGGRKCSSRRRSIRWSKRTVRFRQPTPIEQILLPKGCDFVAYFIVGVDPPDPSERVNVYLPKSLIGRVDRRAAELGMSRSSFFGLAATTALDLFPARVAALRRSRARRCTRPAGCARKPRHPKHQIGEQHRANRHHRRRPRRSLFRLSLETAAPGRRDRPVRTECRRRHLGIWRGVFGTALEFLRADDPDTVDAIARGWRAGKTSRLICAAKASRSTASGFPRSDGWNCSHFAASRRARLA